MEKRNEAKSNDNTWLILALLLGGFVLLRMNTNGGAGSGSGSNTGSSATGGSGSNTGSGATGGSGSNTGSGATGGSGSNTGSGATGGGQNFVTARKGTGIYFTEFDTTNLTATAELVWKENSTNTITARKVTVKTVSFGQKDYLNERVGDFVFYGIAKKGSLLFGIVAYGNDYAAQVDFVDFNGVIKAVLSVPSVSKGLVRIDSSQANNVYDDGLLNTQGIIFN